VSLSGWGWEILQNNKIRFQLILHTINPDENTDFIMEKQIYAQLFITLLLFFIRALCLYPKNSNKSPIFCKQKFLCFDEEQLFGVLYFFA